jgi:hypothetical protein
MLHLRWPEVMQSLIPNKRLPTTVRKMDPRPSTCPPEVHRGLDPTILLAIEKHSNLHSTLVPSYRCPKLYAIVKSFCIMRSSLKNGLTTFCTKIFTPRKGHGQLVYVSGLKTMGRKQGLHRREHQHGLINLMTDVLKDEIKKCPAATLYRKICKTRGSCENNDT